MRAMNRTFQLLLLICYAYFLRPWELSTKINKIIINNNDRLQFIFISAACDVSRTPKFRQISHQFKSYPHINRLLHTQSSKSQVYYF